jgi:hypothetical protein
MTTEKLVDAAKIVDSYGQYAATMNGKQLAYFIMDTRYIPGKGFPVLVAVEKVKGFYETDIVIPFDRSEETLAETITEEMNRRIGLDQETASWIVISTMGF